MAIDSTLTAVLQWYVERIARVLERAEVSIGPLGLSAKIGEVGRSADERIARLDAARANLEDGIKAIDELREEAKKNKAEIAVASEQLARIEKDKVFLETQKEEVRKLMAADVSTFRQVAGIPSPESIRRERVIGFVSGVIASLLASGLVWGGAKAIAAVRR